MNDSAASTAPNAIDADLPCVHCGYNLKTLDFGGQCPECGAAVEDTLAPGRLDPEWVEGLEMGIRFMNAGFGLLAGAILVGILAAVPTVRSGVLAFGAFLALIASYFCWAGGAFEMTRPHPFVLLGPLTSAGTLASAAVFAIPLEFMFVLLCLTAGWSAAPWAILLMLLTVVVGLALLASHMVKVGDSLKETGQARLSTGVVTCGVAAAAAVMIGVSLRALRVSPPLPAIGPLTIGSLLLWGALLSFIGECAGLWLMVRRLRRSLAHAKDARRFIDGRQGRGGDSD